MKDIIWDFELNDIAIVNGDFFVGEDISQQNAALILLKSAVNILDVYFGVGFEQVYANISQSDASTLAAEAQTQVLRDGATECNIKIILRNDGTYDADISAKYR